MVSVLHVTTAGRIGGAERLIADVIRAAQRDSGFRLAVCVLHRASDLAAELADTGVPIYELGLDGPRGVPKALVGLIKLVSRHHFDVIHTHLVHASALGLVAAKAARAPLAVMTRHYDRYASMFGSRTDRLLQDAANRLADHTFAISDAVRLTLQSAEGVAPERITVVPNGIDLARIEHQAGVRSGTVRRATGQMTISSVGSLERRKGHEFLIRALAQLDFRPKPRLILVGDGALRAELMTLAAALGIRDRVDFLGYQANPYPWLARSDLYVQPSLEEGFGISVLEAMALGRPVVASNVGGLPEVVKDEQTGLLVAARQPHALGEALTRLLHDAELRDRLGAAGRAQVRARFDVRLTAARYGDTYRQLLSARGVSA